MAQQFKLNYSSITSYDNLITNYNWNNPQEMFERFVNLVNIIESEFKNNQLSVLTSVILYKSTYVPETLKCIDKWVYDYFIDVKIKKTGSVINEVSMQSLFEPLNNSDAVCEKIISNITEIYNYYNAPKDKFSIQIFINGIRKPISSSRKTKDDVDQELKTYEENRRKEIEDNLNAYEANRRKEIEKELRKEIEESLKREETIARAAANKKVNDFEEQEKARIKKEQEKIESELKEKAEAERKEIENVKQQIINALKENAYDAKRYEEEDEYNKKVEKMPEDRHKFNEGMSEQLRVLSSDFRKSTDKVSDDITDLVAGMAKKLNEEVNSVKNSLDQKISAIIKELNTSTSNIMTSLSTSTETAVNSTVNIERALKNDDFNDLLEAYCRLDSQTYYRRQKGTDSEEYKAYWKGVDAYLRGFKNTLSKFGYEVYSPSVGYSPESVDDVNFDDRECEEYPETNEECKDFIITAIVNSGIRHKENNGEYYIDQRPRIVVKRKDENNDNGDEKR